MELPFLRQAIEGMLGNDVIFSRKKTDSSSRPKKNQFIIFQQKMKGNYELIISASIFSPVPSPHFITITVRDFAVGYSIHRMQTGSMTIDE